jgi:TonB family protein
MKKNISSYLAGLVIYSLIIGLIFIVIDKNKKVPYQTKQTFKTHLIYKKNNIEKNFQNKKSTKKNHKKKSSIIKKKTIPKKSQTKAQASPTQKTPPINRGKSSPTPPEKSSKVYSILDLDKHPELVISIEPKYPEFAKEQGIEGLVILKLIIDTDGSVIEVSIIKSLKEYGFDDEAIKAVKKWKFSKCAVKGTPVNYTIFQPIAFKLI